MTKICMELTNGKKINIDIDEQNAPISAENFLKYVDEGFFDGLIFHRVIPGFMIQGGGFTAEGQGLKEKRATYPGTISMARTMFKNSATTQFFICVNDCAYLDGEYAGFGKVSDQESLDVAIEISKVKTHYWQGYDDIPNEPVVIKTIKRI